MNDITLAPGLATPCVLLVAVPAASPGVAALGPALASAGYRVHDAPDAKGLAASLRDCRPDVVLVAAGTAPEGAGLPDVVAAAHHRRVPVMIYGETYGADERARGYAAGAADVLSGPVIPAELQRRVATQVELHRLRGLAVRSLAHRGDVSSRHDLRLPSPASNPAGGVDAAATLTVHEEQAALRGAREAVALMRVSDSRYVEVNQAFAALTGWPRAEAVGRTALELGLWSDPADRVRFFAFLDAAGELQDFAADFRRRDGGHCTVLLSAKHLRVGAEDCVLLTARDVSAQAAAEQALRESVVRHREAQQVAGVGHWDFDARTGSIRWSEETFRILGVDPAAGEPDYAGYLACVHPEDRARTVAAIEAALAHGLAYSIEQRLVLPDGTLRHAESRCLAHRDAQGTVVALSGTVLDVTERKRAELALRESEARFAGFFQASPAAVAILSDHEGRYVEVNDAWIAFFGFSREQAIGRTARELGIWVNLEDRAAYLEAMRRDGRVHNREMRFRTRSGEIAYVLVSSVPVEVAGERCRLVAQVDITERKRAEAALLESEQRFRDLAAHIADVFYVLDMRRNRAEYVSPAFEKIWGQPVQSALDRIEVWEEALHPEDRESVVAHLTALFSGAHDFDVEYRIVRPDGGIRWVHDRGYAMGDDQGVVTRVVGVCKDVTARHFAALALREREAELEDAQRIAGLGRWEYRFADGHTTWSERVFEMFEIERGAMQPSYEAYLSLAHPEDRERIRLAFREASAARLAYDVVHRILTPAGRRKYVRSIGRFEYTPEGRPLRAVGTVQDVTPLHEAQEAIRASEQRYRELFDLAGVGLWEDDWSELKRWLDDLRAGGVVDLRAHFREHPGAAAEALAKIRVVSVNLAAVRFAEAESKEQLLEGLHAIATEETLRATEEAVCALFEGRPGFEAEVAFRTLKNERRYSITRIDFPPPEGDFRRVIVSVLDITDRKRVTDALREREAELRDAQHIAGLGRWEYDFAADRIVWSDSTYALYEIDPPQLTHTYAGFRTLLHPEDRPRLEADFRTSVEQREPYDIIHRIVTPAGRVKWVRSIGRTEYDADGRPRRTVGTVQDVTALHEAQEAIRDSERRYREIFDLVSVGLWEHDFSRVKAFLDELRAAGVKDLAAYLREHPETLPQALALIGTRDLNQAAVQISHAPGKEALLAGLDVIATPRMLEVVAASLVAIFEGERRFEAENLSRTFSGGQCHTLVTMNLPAPDGDFSRVMLCAVDITERKRVEAALRLTEGRWRSAVEGAGLGIFDWDITSGRNFLSDRWKAMLGYAPDDLPNEIGTWERLCHPEDLPRAWALAIEHLEGKTEDYVCQHRLRARDGSYRWVEARGQVMERAPDGAPLRMLGTHTDIHQARLDRARIERLSRNLERLNRDLEARVEQRTAALTAEIAERKKTEAALQRAHDQLEARVAKRTAQLSRAYADLERSQGKLALAHDIAAIAWWEFEPASDTIVWSEGMFRLMGVEPADLGLEVPPGQHGLRDLAITGDRLSFERFVMDEDWEAGRADLLTAIANGTQWSRDLQVLTGKGEHRWMRTIARGEYDDAGRPVRVFGTVQDITAARAAQEDIRQREERYRQLFEFAAVSLWEHDFAPARALVGRLRAAGVTDLRAHLRDRPEMVQEALQSLPVLDVNRAGVALVGASKEELIRRGLGAIATPQMASGVFDMLAAFFDGEGHFEAEVPLRTTAGEMREAWVSMDFGPPDQHPDRLIVSVLDLTARKRAEAALRESEIRARIAIEGAGLGVFEVHLATGAVVVSDRLQSLLGYGPDELPEQFEAWEPLCHPEDRPGLWQKLQDHVSGATPFLVVQHRLRAKDGSYRWIEARAQVMERDAAGEGVRLVGVHADIHQAKTDQERITVLGERLRLALKVANLGIWERDFRTGARYWDDRLLELAGYTRETFGGTEEEYRAAIHPDDLPLLLAANERALAGEDRFECEFRMIAPGREPVWQYCVAQLTRDPQGEPLRMVGVNIDITASKKAQAALQELNATLEARVRTEVMRNREKDHILIQQSRLAAMGEMFGNIAHQWRQPLNALGLLIANLKDAYEHGELTERYLDAQVDRARRLVQGMSTTIEDFRNFTRPHATRRLFRLEEAVQDALAIVEPAYNQHNVRIELVVEQDSTLLGFGNEYGQVVLNLLANAREAIEERGVGNGLVRITLDRDGDHARLRLQDNGGGVPPEVLPSVFDPYFTTRARGTGIGLYMSKMIIETTMHGQIRMANVDGGAEVTILVPVSETGSEVAL